MTNAPSSRHSLVDLMSHDLAPGAESARTDGCVRVARPWALLDFGALRLRSGWWRLECEADAPLDDIEVRLRSAADPLIVFSGAGQDTDRIYLRGETAYQVSLLASPWPGEVRFGKLRLVRLSEAETVRLLAGGVVRALGRDKPLTRIATVARRLISGHAIGIRLGPATAVAAANATSPPAPGADAGRKMQDARRVERRGDLRVVLANGDRLHPKAFTVAAHMFAADPQLQALYADGCEAGMVVARTGWDPMLARAGAFDGAPVFLRAGPADGAPPSLLDVAAKWGDGAIAHAALPLVLGPARSRPAPALEATPVLAKAPGVSVIIPTKLRIDLLEKCLSGLATQTDYPALEVIVVDNGVTDSRFEQVLTEARTRLALRTVLDAGVFNFSRLINAAAAVAEGEILLLLNDDVEPMAPGWLHRMVASADQPKAGAIGARLLYPNGAIQHAGVMMGLGGPCGHLWKGRASDDPEYGAHICRPGRRMAVTGACMLVRREHFDAVGGYDEAFPVAFNDIDFCLRLRQNGLETIYRGDAVLIHHESQSRGPDDIDHAHRRRLMRETDRFIERWGELTRSDPFGSPAFDPAVERCAPHRSLASACRSA